MSLLNTASPWTNDDSSKKRQSTMRKTFKLKSANQPISSHDDDQDNTVEYPPHSIEKTQADMSDRSNRVNHLIDKITAANESDTKLGEFVPIDNPNITINKEEKDDLMLSRLQSSVPALNHLNRQKIGNFLADDSAAAVFSNYKNSYEGPIMFQKPAEMQLAKPMIDNKVMEKINYMIHMLEAQQHEKTNNITEEFILYTFLGVFIIFVVDSFSRSGKYTR